MPVWIANMLFMLAKATGWSRREILWDIPLSVIYQLEHALLCDKGIRCQRVTSIPSIEDEFEKIKRQWETK